MCGTVYVNVERENILPERCVNIWRENVLHVQNGVSIFGGIIFVDV